MYVLAIDEACNNTIYACDKTETYVRAEMGCMHDADT